LVPSAEVTHDRFRLRLTPPTSPAKSTATKIIAKAGARADAVLRKWPRSRSRPQRSARSPGGGEARAEPGRVVDGGALQDIVVTGGAAQAESAIATTASRGRGGRCRTGAPRPRTAGQLLETVPGLDVTSHRGGKANQYRCAAIIWITAPTSRFYVDENARQRADACPWAGYSDVNFLDPGIGHEYSLQQGHLLCRPKANFASVGAVHLNYLNALDDQNRAHCGTLGFQRLFCRGIARAPRRPLLGALELQHYGWSLGPSDDQRKVNAVLRYSGGDEHDGYSLTGMFITDSGTARPTSRRVPCLKG